MPAFRNVNENCRPGATAPESQPAASDVDVCATLSVLAQVRVSPTATSASSGTKARFPSVSAPLGIETEDEEPPEPDEGDGVGGGDGIGDGDDGTDGEEEPHAVTNSTTQQTRRTRNSINVFIPVNTGRRAQIFPARAAAN